MIPRTLYWEDNALWILDQRKLPLGTEYIECRKYEEVAQAIENLSVRGAPAIGIAAAYGVVLSAMSGRDSVRAAVDRIKGTRPTAVNLFWALDRMEKVSEASQDNILFQETLKEAGAILEEDIKINRAIGFNGQNLLPERAVVITHCNAGALATGGYGTALGVIRALQEKGKEPSVFACETRPVLQGGRLTAWELSEDGIDVTLITDNMAGALMAQGRADAVITGADRIASNGDTANKIGTYSLAVLAEKHGIPFYVAAPFSSFDLNLKRGSAIEIEERNPEEVRKFRSEVIAKDNIRVWNPAFDITPAELIKCIITERGNIFPPYVDNIARIKNKEGDISQWMNTE
jgi:methylthioribose-1-phosphate isomerase